MMIVPGPFRPISNPVAEDTYFFENSAGSIVVVLHARLWGVTFGGIRIRSYASQDAALGDASALAHAMTRKVVGAGIHGGGAKTVINLKPGCDDLGRGELLGYLGDFVQSLGGAYNCGGDLGFTAEDHRIISQRTEFIASADLGDASARSVAITLAAASPKASTVTIQGYGAIGAPLAKILLDTGITVVVADCDESKRQAAQSAGCTVAAEDEILGFPADVFSPCAVGGIISEQAISTLGAKTICGGANNPLAHSALSEYTETAWAIHRHGIQYIPDIISNSGATIVGASDILGESSKIEERMRALGARTTELIDAAREQNRPAVVIAQEEIDAQILVAPRPHTT